MTAELRFFDLLVAISFTAHERMSITGRCSAAALSLVLVLGGKFISSPSGACGRLGAGASQADGV